MDNRPILMEHILLKICFISVLFCQVANCADYCPIIDECKESAPNCDGCTRSYSENARNRDICAENDHCGCDCNNHCDCDGKTCGSWPWNDGYCENCDCRKKIVTQKCRPPGTTSTLDGCSTNFWPVENFDELIPASVEICQNSGSWTTESMDACYRVCRKSILGEQPYSNNRQMVGFGIADGTTVEYGNGNPKEFIKSPGYATLQCEDGYVFADTLNNNQRESICSSGKDGHACVRHFTVHREAVCVPEVTRTYTRCTNEHVWFDATGDQSVEDQTKKEAKCNSNGNGIWDVENYNCVKTCPTIPSMTGGVINYVFNGDDVSSSPVLSNRYKANTIANVICTGTYRMPPGGVDVLHCKPDSGNWNETFTECEEVCHELELGNNVGNVTYINPMEPGYVYREGIAIMSCNETYMWMGEPQNDTRTAECKSGDIWEGGGVSCSSGVPCITDRCFASCPHADLPITNSRMVSPNQGNFTEIVDEERSLLGGTATAYCEITFGWFDMIPDGGSQTRVSTCVPSPDSGDGSEPNATAYWDNMESLCVGECTPLADEIGRFVVYNQSVLDSGMFPVYTEVFVSCDNESGHWFENWSNDETLVCTSDGTWEPEIFPKCVNVCKPFDESEWGSHVIRADYTKINDAKVRSGGSVTFRCQSDAAFGRHWNEKTSELTCDKNGEWSGVPDNCTVLEGPCLETVTPGEKTGRAAAMASQSLSSISLFVMLSILLIIFLVLCDFTLPRLFHMVEELSLLLAHALILPGRSTTLFDLGAFCDPAASPDYQPPQLSPTMCRIIATTLHSLFGIHFGTLFLESLHNYTTYTNVFTVKPLFSRLTMPLTALIITAVIVTTTCIGWFETYTTEDTCWLNFDSTNMYLEVIPFAIFGLSAIVIGEATTMRKFPEHPLANEALRTSASTSATGLMVVSPLSLAAWFIGAEAVYEVDVSLYSLASILNIALGVALLVFHTLGNARARALLTKICCCCCKKNKNESKSTTQNIQQEGQENKVEADAAIAADDAFSESQGNSEKDLKNGSNSKDDHKSSNIDSDGNNDATTDKKDVDDKHDDDTHDKHDDDTHDKHDDNTHDKHDDNTHDKHDDDTNDEHRDDTDDEPDMRRAIARHAVYAAKSDSDAVPPRIS